MQANADRSRSGSKGRSDLVERETRAVAQREQMLLLGLEEADQRMKLRRPLQGQELLLDVRLAPGRPVR